MEFQNLLQKNSALQSRDDKSQEKLKLIREEFTKRLNFDNNKHISVFCGGSLGRGDVGIKSDLDLFILSDQKSKDERRLESLKLLSEIIGINDKLDFPEFSNDGQFIKVYSFPDMLDSLGSPNDDNENLFTVRMLLLLESRSIFNEHLYQEQINKTVDHYFRDSRGRKSFKPLFLLNDLLRFWRTLCLNYELIRDNPERPWRKKNINLKFSRMLTVFGTVLPIIAEKNASPENILNLIKHRPIERLAIGLDIIGDNSLISQFDNFMEQYEFFLKTKEDMGAKLTLEDEELDAKTKRIAEEFSNFIYNCITHSNINPEFIKYLII